MFGGFQPNAFQPDAWQNTDVPYVPPAPTTGGGAGRSRGGRGGRRLARQRVILPDDTVVEVNAIELEELLKEFVRKPVQEAPRKKKRLVRITGADLDRIDFPAFEDLEPFRLELPERYVWQPDPNLLRVAAANLARIAREEEEARIARRRRLKKILLMMN